MLTWPKNHPAAEEGQRKRVVGQGHDGFLPPVCLQQEPAEVQERGGDLPHEEAGPKVVQVAGKHGIPKGQGAANGMHQEGRTVLIEAQQAEQDVVQEVPCRVDHH